MSETFGILIFPGAEELDFTGPWELLNLWRQHADGPSRCLLVAERLEPVACANGMSVLPHESFASCPPLDYLLVPGGQGTRAEAGNRPLLDFIAGQAAGCRAVMSVCTGAFLLHAAGLLSGKRATTYWGALDRLRALGDVTVVEERFVQDGKVWSSAGVSAGMDLVLAFIAGTASPETAGKVQFAAEYYPSSVRYGGAEDRPDVPAYLRGQGE